MSSLPSPLLSPDSVTLKDPMILRGGPMSLCLRKYSDKGKLPSPLVMEGERLLPNASARTILRLLPLPRARGGSMGLAAYLR